MAAGFIIRDFLHTLDGGEGLLRELNLIFVYFEYHLRGLTVIGQHHTYPQKGGYAEVYEDSHAPKIQNFPYSQEGAENKPAHGSTRAGT